MSLICPTAQHILRPVTSYCGIRSEPLVTLNLMVRHDQCGIYRNVVLMCFLQGFLEIMFLFTNRIVPQSLVL